MSLWLRAVGLPSCRYVRRVLGVAEGLVAGARAAVSALPVQSTRTRPCSLREAHGELDLSPSPFAAMLDVVGIWAPTAAFTASEAHMPSVTRQFAALAEQIAARRLVRGRVKGAVAGV